MGTLKHIVRASLFASLVLTGCADNELHLTYTCNPIGATIYETGTNRDFGHCPTTVDYRVTKQDRTNGYLYLWGMTAVWVSGASESSASPIRADLRDGMDQHLNFERPRNVPGYATDAAYALALRREMLAAAQARAAQDEAAEQALSNDIAAFAAGLAASRPVYVVPPQSAPTYRAPTTCNTTALGNSLSTTCY